MTDEWVKLGEHLASGARVQNIELGGNKFVLSGIQSNFVSNWKDRFCLYSGGFGCGKSLALNIKLILAVKCFPKIRVLLGRRTLMDLDRTVLPDLFDLMPRAWYTHRVKDALINFKNGSQVILFGLDALQQGSMADIKKAQQKLKSLNIGMFFIDQLEEVEYEVFNTLDTRMRQNVPVQQGNMTCNPANFWAYHYFKLGKVRMEGEWVKPEKPVKDRFIVEGSMLDNKAHLKKEYLEAQLAKEERWVRRFVYGDWSSDILTDKAVFAPEHIRDLEGMKRPAESEEEGCKIWEQPRGEISYQMGVDPSEGVIDPSSISIISSEGRKVAKWNGKIPMPVLIEKVKFLYYKYKRPLIVPEANAAGAALIEGIKDLNVYRRRQFEYQEDKESERLGFKTSYQSKQALLTHFISLLRRRAPKIYDEQTIEEMKTYVWTDEVKHKGAGAQRSYHDDDVMSTLLGYWEMDPRKFDFLNYEPQKIKPKKPKSFI